MFCQIIARWMACCIHKGTLMGFAPTNKAATVISIDMDRIANSKVVEHYGNWSQFGLVQQLGVIPAMGKKNRLFDKN
jgi:predicted ester cyclase